jgi:hypothetical protein
MSKAGSDQEERRPESERLREGDSPDLEDRAEGRRHTPTGGRSPLGQDGTTEELRIPPEPGEKREQ